MIEIRKSDWVLSAALLVALAGFALAPAASWISAGLAVICAGLVAAHILIGDEVERERNYRAAALAFAVGSAVLLVAAVLRRGDLIAVHADWLWAVAFGTYLVSWTLVRMLRA